MEVQKICGTLGYPGAGPPKQEEVGIVFAIVSSWSNEARKFLVGNEEFPGNIPKHNKVIMTVETHLQGERLKCARRQVQKAGWNSVVCPATHTEKGGTHGGYGSSQPRV